MKCNRLLSAVIFLLISIGVPCFAQGTALVSVDRAAAADDFAVAANGVAAGIYVAPGNPETVRVAAEAFASDVEKVTGVKPRMLTSLSGRLPANLILVGVSGKSPEIDRLVLIKLLIPGKWESAVTAVVPSPVSVPGVRRALVIAGSDRRGAAYALFTLSRQMGVSPWTWWADVPVTHHSAIYVRAGEHEQAEPSVQYRGIFINDEDWGMRPWASKKMDPQADGGKGNFGPHTYERIFELLLRLHANSLWPAMHPGSLPFNAIPENAKLADKWGIVMGASHSEALLRNNVGEWNEKTDGPWNYQTNAAAMNAYWDKRLVENGAYENFYTVGLRGVHDSGLEATGSPQVKAKLVEDVMTAQRALLAKRVVPNTESKELVKVPQILWLYKESLDLYRVGMKVPDDVTLGWTDDNYGYIRELPDAEEQKRSGGSGVYYHVSYWGAPHDYLWLCTTPPALIREEMTKAYDHNARKYWILNVGDLKPAEMDIDYFMQLAVDEPAMAKVSQRDFLAGWFGEQFPIDKAGSSTMASPTWMMSYPNSVGASLARRIADMMTLYYNLNFIRKPEFMGFNGYNDGINRTAFNPLAWQTQFMAVNPTPYSGPARRLPPNTGCGDCDYELGGRRLAWNNLSRDEQAIAQSLPPQYASAFFELVGYPVEGAAAMNIKFLSTDLTFLDVHQHNNPGADANWAHASYDRIQTLTEKYNGLEGGKWDGMMSDAPRERHVFEMPRTATAEDVDKPLPASWGVGVESPPAPIHTLSSPRGFFEQHNTVSMNAAHFARKFDGDGAAWNVLDDLGISGASVEYGAPGLLANQPPLQQAPWLEYEFTTKDAGDATLALHLLPTFAVDSEHRLRYAVALDGGAPVELDASGANGHGPDTATWSANVLRNSAIASVPLGQLAAGRHTLRLIYRDPGVVFEHVVITFPGAPPAYPVPPETK